MKVTKKINLQEVNGDSAIICVKFEAATGEEETISFKVDKKYLPQLGFYGYGEAYFTGLEFATTENLPVTNLTESIKTLSINLSIKRGPLGNVRAAPAQIIGITEVDLLNSSPRKELRISNKSSSFVLKDEGNGEYSGAIY